MLKITGKEVRSIVLERNWNISSWRGMMMSDLLKGLVKDLAMHPSNHAEKDLRL